MCSLDKNTYTNAKEGTVDPLVAIGGAGILFGLIQASQVKPWSCFGGIPAMLGATAILTAFYRSHRFTVNGRISLSNIAKVSLMATSLIGFNVVYFFREQLHQGVKIPPWAGH